MNATILYLSSNKENSDFERKTQETLLANCGDLPIVAVTQKPVDLGPNCKNIVIGDVGASGFNFCRQLQIGLKEVKTRYVIQVESDCIYPPDYFEFRPLKDGCVYRNTNQYVLKYKQGFFKKKSSTFAQIADTKFLLDRLNYIFGLQNFPKWDMTRFNFPKEAGVKFIESNEYFRTKNPAVSFKTGNGMRLHTVTKDVELDEIPYWGTVDQIRAKYL